MYALVVLAVAVASLVLKIAPQSIFACQASGYSADYYLAYCNAAGYGEYEHGAFWFGLEPAAITAAANADVMFIGNSQLQYGFSTDATRAWFAVTNATPYLLGFAAWENVLFTGELLRRFRPAAKVYVVNIEGFFSDREAPVAQVVMHDRFGLRYAMKRFWQLVHRPFCGGLSAICGHEYVIFRSRRTGAWHDEGTPSGTSAPVAYDRLNVHSGTERSLAIAARFLAELDVPHRCIILTLVPSRDTRIADAKAMAEGLNTPLILPELDRLETFDGSHLTHSSAERWSEAFLDDAAPIVRECLRAPGAAS